MEFRHSICNEAFDQWPFADACRAIRQAGYTGIEIAPFTLAATPGEITAAQRAEYRDIMGSEGLQFAGLHWLMVSPKGLHVTGPDAELRRRSSASGPVTCRPLGLTISQCNPANCKPSEPMMSRYSARCAAVISRRVTPTENGAISIPVYPALRIARQASANGHWSKASLQMEWRNSMNYQCTGCPPGTDKTALDFRRLLPEID